MASQTTLETVLRRDRSVILAGLIIITALAWIYMVYLAQSMSGMDMSMDMDMDMQMSSDMPMKEEGMSMNSEAMSMDHDSMAMGMVMSWTAVDFIMTFVMWAVMMVAMMVPAAAPMILIFAGMNRKKAEQQQPYIPTTVFMSGYLIVWWGFALLATVAQWGLHQAALLSSMMGKLTPVIGGIVVIAAGIFQWTPWKNVCLEHCRGPIGFMMAHWRDGLGGTLYMGMHHGLFCLGCCWFLMGLMFVAGVMSLFWMAVIAAFILLEKVVPKGAAGTAVVWGAGIAMLGWGGWMIFGAVA